MNPVSVYKANLVKPHISKILSLSGVLLLLWTINNILNSSIPWDSIPSRCFCLSIRLVRCFERAKRKRLSGFLAPSNVTPRIPETLTTRSLTDLHRPPQRQSLLTATHTQVWHQQLTINKTLGPTESRKTYAIRHLTPLNYSLNSTLLPTHWTSFIQHK